jgi:Outer membrane protein beta-barrel domain
MQEQDNHMEELFRRAAEGYPLKTGDSNWDRIAASINSSANALPVAGKQNAAEKYRRFLLPVILLTTAVIASTFISNPGHIKNNKPINITNTTKNTKPVASLTAPALNVTDKNNTDDKTIKKLLSKTKLINPVLIQTERKGPPAGDIIYANKIDNGIPASGPVTNNQLQLTYEKPITSENKTINEPANIQENKKETVAASTKPVLNNKSKNRKGIYAGIIVGAGFNEVKNQWPAKPGFEFGARAGYRFNSRFSAEAGIVFAKKNYYSDGKFFKMDKVAPSMPTGMEILSLNGSSSVFQIPVKIKYNFPLNKKAQLFGTAGISSYILTKEKNDYFILYNGTRQTISSTYNEQHRYLAAALDISIGYEIKHSKNKSLRIEPYLQVPLKGIGVGKMPVTGAGLHLGYTLFKN